MCMSVCKSIRHYSRFQLGAFRQPAIVSRPRQARSLSTFRIPLSPLSPARTGLSFVPASCSRSYWWSSRTTPSEPSPPPNGTETLQNELTTPLSQPSNNVPLEESASNLSTSEEAAANSETLTASTPDILPDALPPPPLQLGDLKELGFSNFTPVGAVQSALEFVQVTTGLPWWGTIALTTVIARLAILHFVVKTTRTTARMAPLRPQMDVLMKEAGEARAAGDQLRVQVAVLKLNKLRKDNNLGFGASMSGPLAQGVVSISMFLGIKRLCDFPLPQLKFESVGWLSSLTAPDPYYILPALSLAVMNLQIYLTRGDMAASGPNMLHFANGFRVLAFVFAPIVAQLPAALLLHLVLNLALVGIQSRVLRSPGVRRALDIPPLPTHSSIQYPTMRDTWNALKKWFTEQKAESAQKARERMKVPTFPAQAASPVPTRRPTKQATRGRKV